MKRNLLIYLLLVAFLTIPSSSVAELSRSNIAPAPIIMPYGEANISMIVSSSLVKNKNLVPQSMNLSGTQPSTYEQYKIFFPFLPAERFFYVSTVGNDNNPGTETQPWRTIQKAANTLESDQTAIVLPGRYDEAVEISTSGITLQAQGRVITKNVYISGNSNTLRGFTITDPSSDWGIRTTGNNNLVDGNEIYHTGQDGIWFFGSNNTFRSNYIHDILDPSAYAGHIDCFQTWGGDWGATNILFERNLCINNNLRNYGNQLVMLARDTTAQVSNIIFRNNILVIYNPVYSALNFWWDENSYLVSSITVENNTIVNMTRDRRADGIDFINITGATAINNLFINFGDEHTSYVGVVGGSNINIRNNSVYNIDGIPPKGSPYPGDIWMLDPRVVDLSNLNFHLRSNSPLINAGYYLGDLVPDDFGGIPRPQGAGFDIGAYEYLGQ